MKKVFVFRVEVPEDERAPSLEALERGFRGPPFHLAVRGVEMRVFHEAEPADVRRDVPVSEVLACPDRRLDAVHYVPRHRVEEHRRTPPV